MQSYKVIEQIKFLSEKELERFFNRINDKRDRALFLTIYRYGLRVSEATLLTLDDIDMENRLIYIRRVKNGRSTERRLFPDIRRALNAYLPNRNTGGDALFTGRCGDLSRSMIQKLFTKYIKGIAKMSVHCLRHTCAIQALESGLDILDVQDLLGHRSITSTMVYAQITSKRRKKADDILSAGGLRLERRGE